MRDAILTGILSVLLCFQSQAQSPNFVLIFCDDLSFLGSEWMDQAITPNLDALEASGVNFTNAHANVPICAPSRASVFNGLQAYSSGFYGHDQLQNEFSQHAGFSGVTTLFQHLRDNGYTVNATGKIFHTIEDSHDYFSEYHDMNTFNGPYPWNGLDYRNDGSPVRNSHPSTPASVTATGQGVASLAEIPSYPDYTGWLLGPEPYMYTNDSVRDLMTDEKAVAYLCDLLAEEHEDPFFFTAGLYRPHSPFYVPQRYFDLYPLDQVDISQVKNYDLEGVSTSMISNNMSGMTGFRHFDDFTNASMDSADTDWWLKRNLQGYLASVSFIDDQIGKVMEGIVNSEYGASTYLIVTSDHGLHVGRRNSMGKNLLWSASTQIPFIVAGPGVPTEVTDDRPISLVDLYPTLVDMAQVGPPSHTLDGHSLKEIIYAPETGVWEGPDHAISAIGAHDDTPLFTPSDIQNQHYSIVDSTYRFILLSSGETELYDRINDPKEQQNLTNDPAYQSVKEDLKSRLMNEVGLSIDRSMAIDTLDAFFYGDFELGLNAWTPLLKEGSTATYSTVDDGTNSGNKELLVHVQSLLDDNSSNVQLVNSCLSMDHDKDYRLSFKARSATPGELKIFLKRNGNPDYNELASKKFSLTDQWQEYEMLYIFPDSSTRHNSRLTFQFLDENRYYLDDIRIRWRYATCSDTIDTAPVGLTKSYNPVNGIQDRVQLKWYKETPKVKYTDTDAVACDIKFWAKRHLNPLTGDPIGDPIQNPDTVILVDKQKTYSDGSPKSIFKWPVMHKAEGANNTKRVDPNTRYNWQVRCACDMGAGRETPWSTAGVFNTPNFDPVTGIYLGKSLASQTDSKQLYVFPNPAKDQLTIALEAEKGENWEIRILDITGRQVYRQQRAECSGNTTIQISLSDLGAGQYFVSARSDREQMIERFVIDR